MKLTTEDVEQLSYRVGEMFGDMIRQNMPMVVRDLERAEADRMEGDGTVSIPVKVTAEIRPTGERRVFIEGKIEWTKKVTRTDETEPVTMDFAQPELEGMEIEIRRKGKR